MLAHPTEKTAELLEHLHKLSYEEARSLFERPWVPGVIIRFLEEGERTLLMRLIVVPPLQFSSIAEWYKDPNEAKTLLSHLGRLRLVRFQQATCWVTADDVEITRNMTVDVESTLKTAIQKIITGECFVPQALPGTIDVVKPAKERWFDLLNSILEENRNDTKTAKKTTTTSSMSSSLPQPPSSPISAILVSNDQNSLEMKIAKDFLHDAGITSARRGLLPFGFEFMLKDTRTQVLLLLDTCLRKFSGQGKRGDTEYDGRTERRINGWDLVYVLSTVMWLSTLKPGCSYSYSRPPAEFSKYRNVSEMLELLEYLGLICLDLVRQTLSVTPLLANSVDVRRGFECAESAELFEKNSANIIVESNFSVYAYTSNTRNINLLKLFTRNVKALPGFYVAILTRDDVQRAIKRGITRQLIEDFLTKNAHPCLGNQKTVIPDNVVDQLVIWEKEKERYEFHLASKIKISDTRIFNYALSCANDAKALLHNTTDTLYIKKEYKEELLRLIDHFARVKKEEPLY